MFKKIFTHCVVIYLGMISTSYSLEESILGLPVAEKRAIFLNVKYFFQKKFYKENIPENISESINGTAHLYMLDFMADFSRKIEWGDMNAYFIFISSTSAQFAEKNISEEKFIKSLNLAQKLQEFCEEGYNTTEFKALRIKHFDIGHKIFNQMYNDAVRISIAENKSPMLGAGR